MARKTPPSRINRRFWDQDADDYQSRHGARLAETPMAWGIWRIPESDLGVLGDVRGLGVLELGCGAAQWSAALAERGARTTAIDLSERQLAHARKHLANVGVDVALVQSDAETLPFRDASFDVVFGDHGAVSFSDPRKTIPEAARVLREGGLLALCGTTPLTFVCWNYRTERLERRLHQSYFTLGRHDTYEMVEFQLSYGEWVRLFRRSGLAIEDLVELRPPEGARTTYDEVASLSWARQWPAEHIWKLRKE